MSRENLVLTESGMRRAIHAQNHAEKMYKHFSHYGEFEGFNKEKLAAQYWKGRLTEIRNSYKSLKETREILLKDLR
jgi:bisphosphoglycerate-dependent phosphoglycerate mutase